MEPALISLHDGTNGVGAERPIPTVDVDGAAWLLPLRLG